VAYHEFAHLHPDGTGPAAAAPVPPPAAAPRWLLILLTAIGPASFQIFLPSLPAIRDGFGVDEGTAQLALSLSMLGMAVATLAYGSLADRFGRRPVLLGGMGLLLAGSLACAAAPSIGVLIAGRIVQAAGGASGMVVTRAIVVDVYGRERSGQVLAALLTAMMIAPMLATPLGGVLNDTLGWRANFLAIAAAAAAMLGFVFLRLGETRPAGAGGAGSSAWLPLADYRRLLASRCFNGFAFQGAFAMAAFTAYSTGAPYALQGAIGLSATEVGLSFVVISVGFAAGGLLAMRLPASLRLSRRAMAGSLAGVAATTVAAALALGDVWTVAAVVAPAAAFGFATGITMPASQAGAIGAVPELSGTASGLSGFLGTILGAAAAQVVGLLSDGTPVPVALAMAAMALASCAAAVAAFGQAPRSA